MMKFFSKQRAAWLMLGLGAGLGVAVFMSSVSAEAVTPAAPVASAQRVNVVHKTAVRAERPAVPSKTPATATTLVVRSAAHASTANKASLPKCTVSGKGLKLNQERLRLVATGNGRGYSQCSVFYTKDAKRSQLFKVSIKHNRVVLPKHKGNVATGKIRYVYSGKNGFALTSRKFKGSFPLRIREAGNLLAAQPAKVTITFK